MSGHNKACYVLCMVVLVHTTQGQLVWTGTPSGGGYRTSNTIHDTNTMTQSSWLPPTSWMSSSPSIVNLVYTWLHPQHQVSSAPSVIKLNPAYPSAGGGAVQKLSQQHGSFNRQSSSEEQDSDENYRDYYEKPKKGIYENTFSCPAPYYRNTMLRRAQQRRWQVHPHFGRWLGQDWQTSAKITDLPGGVSIVERGSRNTANYSMYYKNEQGPISPFHDIPLFANEGNKIFNMVVEVPRWSNAKMEIATKDPLNPIKQDVKKGKLRYVANVFPHHGYIWNYGALPQTWENPNHVDESTGEKGDNDPIDVCEIGYRVAKPGEVLQVKVLGILAMLDEGETDWKVLAIDVNDPLAPQLSDIDDVEQHMPGFLKATVEWFRLYKVPDGKPENAFGFNGEAKNREFAHQIILGTHVEWRDLVCGKSDKGELNIGAVSVPYASSVISADEAKEIIGSAAPYGEPAPIDAKVDQWHYVNMK